MSIRTCRKCGQQFIGECFFCRIERKDPIDDKYNIPPEIEKAREKERQELLASKQAEAPTASNAERARAWIDAAPTLMELNEQIQRKDAEIAELRAAFATQQEAQPQATGPLSFNCANGCGACGVKLRDFVTHATQAQYGDDWVTVASEPEIVSTCCGSPVEVWDERKQDIVGQVRAAQAEPAGGDKEDAERLIIPTLTRAIQSIRGSTYNLTKDECIFVLENLRDDAARAAQQATGVCGTMDDKVQSIMALKPCPFCGNETPEFERMGTPRQSCIVICGHCGARHESSDEGEFNGTSWNERTAIREAITAPGVAQGWKLIGWTCGDGDCGRIHDTRPDDDADYMQAVYVMTNVPTAEQERPPYCGSGHCSCIECPYGSIKGGTEE